MTNLNYLLNLRSDNRKGLAVLIDPDKIVHLEKLNKLIDQANELKVDFIFVGGSIVSHKQYGLLISSIKSRAQVPVLLFPGNYQQLHPEFDAVLFLALLSGRNPEYLIGQHVLAAKTLKESGVETIPTAYLLIGDDHNTSVAYVSNTTPIPSNQENIAVNTAIAGELLGFRCIYTDAGSGADEIIPPTVISAIHNNTSIPLIVGGGIKSDSQARTLYESGADVIVIGNKLEEDPDFLMDIINLRNTFNQDLKVH